MAIFGNTFGGGAQGGGMSPINMALMGLLAYRTLNGKGRLAEMLGRSSGNTAPSGATVPASPAGDSVGGLLGGLGGLLGGQGAGTAISDGLHHLMDLFQQNGHGDKLQSWVSSGPNKPISASELEQALGVERVQWLIEQTGLPKEELLAGLSRKLPETVAQLTPDGRLPYPEEAVERIQTDSDSGLRG
jgi:uncharacterized protein YidB (DUF937 family)